MTINLFIKVRYNGYRREDMIEIKIRIKERIMIRIKINLLSKKIILIKGLFRKKN